MREPYYLELDEIGPRALRMKVMDSKTKEPVAQRDGSVPEEPDAEKRRGNWQLLREQLAGWARWWVERHRPSIPLKHTPR